VSDECTVNSVIIGVSNNSSSSLDILNDRKRFPTFVPMAAASYNNVALAMLAIMRRYGWTRFNAMCDTNQKDPQFLVMDVSCSISRRVFQSTEISMTYAPFNSENEQEITTTLNRCRTLSTGTSCVSALNDRSVI
jgi:hypothetical protein